MMRTRVNQTNENPSGLILFDHLQTTVFMPVEFQGV